VIENAPRSIDGEDLPGRPGDPRQVERRPARPAADVEETLAGAEAGAPEAVEHAASPDAVLQTEPLDLLVMRAEDVIPFRRAHAFASLTGPLDRAAVRRRPGKCRRISGRIPENAAAFQAAS